MTEGGKNKTIDRLFGGDRRFYDCSLPHKRMKVNDVLFDGMLHITIINSLVIYNNQEHVEQLSLRHYMEKLCKCLLSN
jgi:hypothetical protein